MSKHSKWANIKNRKGVQDKKRSNIFTKLSKDITVAVKQGGSDVGVNFRLRLAIDKAKSASMPKENIERAISRGSGLIEGEVYDDVLYEGFGPFGVAFVIEAVTDNRHRTASNIRTIFSKADGTLGTSNSVIRMFDHFGIIKIDLNNSQNKDELFLEVIDLGVIDLIEIENSNKIILITDIKAFQKVKEFLEEKNFNIINAEFEYIANTFIELNNDTELEKINNLIDKLYDDDDVRNVFVNLKI